MWMASFCRCFAFAHKCTAIFCNADWTQMAAAVPAEWTVPLSRIRCWVLCWGFFFFYAAFNFILTRVRGEIFFSRQLRGAVVLLAPMWLKNIIGRSLCGAVFVTLRAGEAMTTNCPPPPSQGQGWWVCQGSCSLDLFCWASPFLCQEGSPSLQIHTVNFYQERWGRIQPAFLFYRLPGCDHTQIHLSSWFSPLNKCEPAFCHSLYTLSIEAWWQTK